MATKEQAIQALIEPTVNAMGFELWGVDYVAQGKNSRLVVYIDSDKGVNVDDCAKVSRQVSGLLDVEDPIAGQYNLEVSSPGMDRPLYTLSQFERFAGHRVQLRLRIPFEGRRKFQGLLIGLEEDEVILRVDQEEFGFPIETIERAQVVPTFEK
ncbi:ribosome maturation factor RimP [Halotalea alkalilenta]|uniref:Ribosome maturation factor RimP n=1 Tax=Halotalea alkalilenta TaxID=376489 RepID=A0A172YA10_9GAMM|nr:ribosome maturation factor RimP [Halotalea alkalilenta]ANF56073.1 ribosome maturation factor RimP [Halotalea alkalilenta]